MKIQNLNLSYLKYFIDTVEASSLTKAAEMNHITRPAVSQAITRLEEWVGQRIITHKKKSFELTREGRIFYFKAKSAFQNFDKDLKSNLHSDTLRIGCSASLAENVLLPVLSKFDPSHIHLKFGTTSHLLELLKRGEINLALFIDQDSARYPASDVLFDGRFVLASKAKFFSGILVTTEDRPEVRSLIKSLLRKKVEVTSHQIVESWTLCSKVALAFNGASLIPDFLAKAPLQAISVPGFKSSFSVICARGNKSPQTDAEMKFIALLKENHLKR